MRGGRSLEDVYFSLTTRGAAMSSRLPGRAGGSAAPARVLAQAGFETRTLLANGEQLLVSLVLPALALVGLTLASVARLGPGPRADVAPAGALALAVVSTAFTGQAISTGFDRRVRRAAAARHHPPRARRAARRQVRGRARRCSRSRSSCSACWGWRWARGRKPAASCRCWSTLLGSATFVALALLLAGTLRAEAVLAIANLLWVLLLGLGRAAARPTCCPGALGTLAALLPSGALGDAVRTGVVDGGVAVGAVGGARGVGPGRGALARRFFRWGG